jgi:hypothetical protein
VATVHCQNDYTERVAAISTKDLTTVMAVRWDHLRERLTASISTGATESSIVVCVRNSSSAASRSPEPASAWDTARDARFGLGHDDSRLD